MLVILLIASIGQILIRLSSGEVIVITSAEENTFPVFEVYDTSNDTIRTVNKVSDVA